MIILKLNIITHEADRKRILEDLKKQFRNEPFVLIPNYIDVANNPKNVLYLCDKRACEVCHGSECGCRYTGDIAHAKNFKNVMGAYIEQEVEQ